MNNQLDQMKNAGNAYNGTVYRGTNLEQSQINEILASGNYKDASYTSTSINSSVADSFNGNVKFEIQNTSSGVNIQSVPNYSSEAEILFKPNTEFKVVDQYYDAKGKLVIVMEEMK